MDSDDRVDFVGVNALWLDLVRVLLAGAALVAGYLAYQTLFEGAGLPGCGPSSGCDKVLSSPWAKWLGIPVSLPGLGLYLVFFTGTFFLNTEDGKLSVRMCDVLVSCSFLILGGALWFTAVQAIVLNSLCPFCCVAHGLASMGAAGWLWQFKRLEWLDGRVNVRMWGYLAILMVGLVATIQMFFPSQPSSPKIVHFDGVKSVRAKGGAIATNVLNLKGKFEVPGTGVLLDLSHLPVMGDRRAKHLMGLLFDYTCHDCRKQHSWIRRTIDIYDGELACVLMPMPLDAKCNPVVEETYRDHIDACEYAKICLAIHFVAPEKYNAFDRWLFEEHEVKKDLSEVRKYAENLVGGKALDVALGSEELRKQLDLNIRVYDLSSQKGNSGIPQVIIKNEVHYGPASSEHASHDYLRESFGLE